MDEGGQTGNQADALAFLDLGGEMGRLIRAHDWAATSLGPIEAWPQSLRTAVGMILLSPVPIVMLWGEDGVMIYNQAYSVFAGGRHPALLGSKVREGWPEIADFNDHVMKVGLSGGALSYKDQELTLHRDGRPGQVWVNLDYSPVLGESGKPAGVIAIVVETTERVRRDRALSESEARFREVADSAPSPVWVTNAQGGVEFANKAFAEFSGLPVEKLLGNTWASLIHDEDLPRVAAARAEAWEQKEPYAFEARFCGAQDEWRSMLVSSSPRIDAEGALQGYVGMAVDLTDIRRAGDALRESEARFRRIADSSPTPMWVSRLDRKREFVNRAYLDFLGLPYEEAVGFDWREILHPEDFDRIVAESIAGEASLQTFELEGRYRRGDGEWCWLHSVSQPRFDGEGALTGFIGVAHDITESKQAEVALAARNRRLDLLARIAGGLVLENTEENRLPAAFDEIAAEVGADFYFNYLIDPSDAGAMRLAASRGLTDEQRAAFGAIRIGEYLCGRVAERREPVIAADLEKRDDSACEGLRGLGGRSYAGFPLIAEGRLMGTISFSSRGRAEFDAEEVALMATVADQVAAALDRGRVIAALREGEERLRAISAEQAAILGQLAEGVIVTDEKGAITFVNDAAARIHGVARLDVTPEKYSETYHLFTEDGEPYPPAELPLARVVASGEPLSDERWRIRAPDGREVLAVGSARPVIAADNRRIGSVLTLRDDTARLAAEGALRELNETLEQRVAERTEQLRASEAALRQSQKMEAIGKLTGGVAHDFNNLLQVVSGNLELLEQDVAGDARAERRVRHAREGVARGAKLASQLLAFGRRQPLEPKVINIGRFVRGLDDMLRRALGEEIEIETRVAEGLWNTLADPNQIENALLNLAINARDAMGGEGRLTIEVANVSAAHDGESEEVAPGEYVMIAVGDTGSGIPREIVDKVFEPFFSTKAEGKGTGLGLSMVHGFIKQSGGHVRIESEVGRGTTIRLYLPRADRPEDAAVERERAAATGGSETILVVEDDEDVRTTVVETLGEFGYHVLEAPDAASALAIVEQGARVDLLFTDVVMPGPLRSPELARRARERLPDLAVLFTSGYTEDAIVHDGRLDEGVRLISKPYSSDALAAKIREALAGQKRGH